MLLLIRYCRRLIFSIAVVLALILSAFLWCFTVLRAPLIPSSANRQPAAFVFVPGTSSKSLSLQLYKEGLLPHPFLFLALATIENKATLLHAGEYRITPGVTTAVKLLDMMAKGEVVRHSQTIVEGWNFAQLKASITSNPYLVHDLQGLGDADIMRKIGHEGEEPEGRFAPETYVFSGKISDTTILRSAYQRMHKQLNAAWQDAHETVMSPSLRGALPKCPYEALIIASMIEKESAYSKERPRIAGVIMRRLQLGMPLQIDATVIYGLNKNLRAGAKEKLQLSLGDLKKDTPYNTYSRFGLPSTPIAMPGKDAIFAALHPAMGEEIYYVAKGDGTHVFTRTLTEHDVARKKYYKTKGNN